MTIPITVDCILLVAAPSTLALSESIEILAELEDALEGEILSFATAREKIIGLITQIEDVQRDDWENLISELTCNLPQAFPRLNLIASSYAPDKLANVIRGKFSRLETDSEPWLIAVVSHNSWENTPEQLMQAFWVTIKRATKETDSAYVLYDTRSLAEWSTNEINASLISEFGEPNKLRLSLYEQFQYRLDHVLEKQNQLFSQDNTAESVGLTPVGAELLARLIGDGLVIPPGPQTVCMTCRNALKKEKGNPLRCTNDHQVIGTRPCFLSALTEQNRFGHANRKFIALCEQWLSCHPLRDKGFFYAININPRDLTVELFNFLKEHYPQFLRPQTKIEITEGGDLNGDKVELLKKLSELGFPLALDDFGTVNANLDRIRHFEHLTPPAYLKIDRQFLEGKGCDLGPLFLLAKNHGMYITVEGIETAEQLRMIANICSELSFKNEHVLLQGFGLHKPSSISHIQTQ